MCQTLMSRRKNFNSREFNFSFISFIVLIFPSSALFREILSMIPSVRRIETRKAAIALPIHIPDTRPTLNAPQSIHNRVIEIFDEDGFDWFQQKKLILNVLQHDKSSSNIVNYRCLLLVQCLRWNVTKMATPIFILAVAAKLRRPQAYPESPQKSRKPYFLGAP
jgi:hypothetical protein